jgi:1-acyl-sn-glycerol-3-phosphate acyltransferase
MQDSVFIQKPYRFVPPIESSWLLKSLLKLRVHKLLFRSRGVVKCEIRNAERLQHSVSAGHGVMLTPNHPRTSDPIMMCELTARTGIPFYTMASWHLFNQNFYTTLAIRTAGGFSVNREGLDRTAVDYAIKTLQNARRPLLIFPEGTTSGTNDRLMALMDGPAFIARTAAKRRSKNPIGSGKVVVHPIGIRYLFDGDLKKACNPVLTRIEKKLTWRPDPEQPLVKRIIKIGDALLRLKELQYGLLPDNQLSHKQRQNQLVNQILEPLEQQWLGGISDAGIAIRIKNLRVKIFPELSLNTLDTAERQRRWRQIEDTYLAQQIDCYPEQYLTQHRSVDRILDTVRKFEEDLTDQCGVDHPTRVIIDVDEAIEVSPERQRGQGTDALSDQIRIRLEAKLEHLQKESKMA